MQRPESGPRPELTVEFDVYYMNADWVLLYNFRSVTKNKNNL